MNLRLILVVTALLAIFALGNIITGDVVLDSCTWADRCEGAQSVSQLPSPQQAMMFTSILLSALLVAGILHLARQRKS